MHRVFQSFSGQSGQSADRFFFLCHQVDQPDADFLLAIEGEIICNKIFAAGFKSGVTSSWNFSLRTVNSVPS